MSERNRLIREGEKYHIGYDPGATVYHWLLRAVLFLLKEKTNESA